MTPSRYVCLLMIVVATTTTAPFLVKSFTPQSSILRWSNTKNDSSKNGPLLTTTTTSSSSSTSTRRYVSSSSTSDKIPDYTGKIIYQRTFYRLTPSSTVSYPNALVLEERLRYKPDPQNEGYILPYGPRTYIFREGTDEDRITDELYRINLGSIAHNGPGTMDTTIATILYLASNPEIIQGQVLELACETGAATLIGCAGARFVLDPDSGSKPNEEGGGGGMDIMTLPKRVDIFPKRMQDLTLSGENQEELRDAYDNVKGFPTGKVSLKDVRWSTRIPGRRYGPFYRLIVGSDIDFSYPTSKELARTIANYLLPSNEFAVSNIKNPNDRSGGGGGGGFGAIGMDLGTPRSTNGGSSSTEPSRQVDTTIPSTFVHVCPDTRETTKYLRQYLEKGFRMTVNTGYLKMERLQFVFQAVPEEEIESTIEEMDLELKDETFRSYQVLRATHHPDYAGDGNGEYFFPLETGEYEGGRRSTYLEPEEGGSPW